jgi:putative ABC transport system permease protein
MVLGVTSTVDPEQYRFPVVMSVATYAFASLIVLAAAALTAVNVWRRIGRLDLASALKARD